MTRKLSHGGIVSLAAVGMLAVGISAFASNALTSSAKTVGATTLVMESSPESTITQDFNPFVSTAAPQGMGATGLIYEPLIQFDLAAPPKYYPWLATSYQWSDSVKSITFTIRQGVKWNNGTPMTPADVAFTYKLIKANASINLGGLNIATVSTSGNTVTVTFPTSQYSNLQEIAGVAILPKSIWGAAGNPATFADANPVGTGPDRKSTRLNSSHAN